MTKQDSDRKKIYSNEYPTRQPGQADDSELGSNYPKKNVKVNGGKTPIVNPFEFMKRKKLIEKLKKARLYSLEV
jgi:hypothetical protein